MKKFLYFLLIFCAAVLMGGLLGELVKGADALKWLGYAKSFSFEPSKLIDLDVLTLTFGISFNVNVSQIMLILTGIFVYSKTVPKVCG